MDVRIHFHHADKKKTGKSLHLRKEDSNHRILVKLNFRLDKINLQYLKLDTID